jgi:hypothetical protein
MVISPILTCRIDASLTVDDIVASASLREQAPGGAADVLAKMHGQPDSRFGLRRSCHPMDAVGGNQDMVARMEIVLTFSVDPEAG